MVLIRERLTESGRYYILKELCSGRQREWRPPRNLRWDQVEVALTNAANLFEQEVLTDRNVNETPLMTLGGGIVSSVTLLKDYAEMVFMPRKTVTIAEHTRDTWQGYLNNRIYPRLGHIPIGEVTASHIIDFLLGCQAEGLSVSTVKKYYTLLNRIFRMAFTTDVIGSNPMDKVDSPTPRKDEFIATGISAYNAKEIAHIEDCLRSEPLKWQALIGVLIDTGVRVGECCGLKWEDVDFHKKTILIKGGLCYTSSKGIYLSTPKNRRERVISVSDDVMFLLLQLYIQNAASYDSPFVFTQARSVKPMHPQTPGKHLRSFAKRNNIDHLYPHKLRHSYASVAITNGADIASVSEVLGHCDKATTLRMYTSANEESMRRASDIRRETVKKAN